MKIPANQTNPELANQMSNNPHLVIYSIDEAPKNTPQPSKFLPNLLPQRTFAVHLLTSFQDVTTLLHTISPSLVILECECKDATSRKRTRDMVKRIRTNPNGNRVFIALWSVKLSLDARERQYWISKGFNIILGSDETLMKIVETVGFLNAPKREESSTTSLVKPVKGEGDIECYFCGLFYKIDLLSIHVGLYHGQESKGAVCSLCDQTAPILAAHLKSDHPCGKVTIGTQEFDCGIAKSGKLSAFVLVVVKLDDKYLLVDELGSQGWYLPGGRVDQGEDMIEAAIRETKTETNIDISIKGILRTEYTPTKSGFRLRMVLYGEPKSNAVKLIPDNSSNGACWVSLKQLNEPLVDDEDSKQLALRGPEAFEWIQYVEQGIFIFIF